MGCGCNQTIGSLGNLSDAEFQAIVKEHINNLDSATKLQIGLEAATGKFDTLTNSFKSLQGKICTTGAENWLIDNLPVLLGGGAALVVLGIIFGKTALRKL